MNIFRIYTRKTLRLNRTRTLVTVVGIILSVALITAVAEGGWSGMVYMRHVVEATTGAFSGFYENMTAEEAAGVAADGAVESAVTWQEVGYAEVASQNPDKPYLYIVSVSGDFDSLVAVQLTAGRMPQTESEILLPEHLAANGDVRYALGDTLTLEVGARTLEGSALSQHNAYQAGECIADTVTHTYTVVGFYERFDNLIEDYSAPGYTALTAGAAEGSYTVFFRLHSIRDTLDYLAANPRSGVYFTNSDLLYYYGSTDNNYLYTTMAGLVAILVALIMFGSVILIYNSFSISVGERTKQFGLLKSIGATNRQLRGAVLYEALVLCAAAIPLGLALGCAGIGVTLRALRGTFDQLVSAGTSGISVRMGLALNGWALLFAAAVGLLTALISAWIPAKRAARVTAIDAIRQTNDVAIRGKQVRTSKATYRLFGFPGMLASKNYKRNRKRYCATVLSLFLSIVLFISASSFCAYLGDSVETVTDARGYDLRYHDTQADSGDDQEALYQKLLAAKGVTGGAWASSEAVTLAADPSLLTDTYLNEVVDTNGYDVYAGNYSSASGETVSLEGAESVYAAVYFVRDETYRALLAENGLDEATYYNAERPVAVLYDSSTYMTSDEDGARWFNYETFNSASLPCTVQLVTQSVPEGYISYGSEPDEDTGELVYLYAPETLEGDGELQESDILRLPAAEVLTMRALRIGARIGEAPMFAESGLCLIYPASFRTAVMGASTSAITVYYYASNDHAASYDDMRGILLAAGRGTSFLTDYAADNEMTLAMITVVNVFSYGFIVLISLIALANVFNTISTNISLRRREFAMLKSVGMTRGGFNRMMNFECLLYGLKGLLYGLPVSVFVTWLIYRSVSSSVQTGFYVPWYSVAIAVGSVFLVVFATMLYAMDKIKNGNLIDALKNENI